ncbi:MAG: PilZ domain-containing protein [Epulopiscium sp.]|jgi:hypothetical protein|nr:PilZ domain-containing protein [Candidatus Epulonipiscium sp.]
MRSENYIIFTQDNVKLCEAELIYINIDRAAFIIDSVITLTKISRMEKIRFHKVEDYPEMFEAEVYQVKGEKLFVENLKNITAQLRSDLKVRVSYKSSVRVIDSASPLNINIQSRDISCGGICFQAEQDLMTTELYETVVPITQDPIILKLRIIRKVFDKEKNVYVYGARFVELKHNEERMLRQAIFRLQMIARKKIKVKEKQNEKAE